MNPEHPRISIVTPSYNQAAFLEETICSVLDQGYPNLEYIVIDGGSSDGSVDIIRRYEDRLAYWVSEPDSGQTSALNKGFAMAHGEILAWLNSDDVYRPGALAAVTRIFAERPDVDLIYGDCDLLDEQGELRYTYHSRPFNLRALLTRFNFIQQQATFFRRKALEDVGSLDESLHYVMDWDLWLRMSKKHKAEYLPVTLAGSRKHPMAKTTGRLTPAWAGVAEIARMTRRHGAPLWSRNNLKNVGLWILARLRLQPTLSRLFVRAGLTPGRRKAGNR